MRTRLDTIRETIEEFNRGPIETRTLVGDLALKIRLALTREWPEAPPVVHTAILNSQHEKPASGLRRVDRAELLASLFACAPIGLRDLRLVADWPSEMEDRTPALVNARMLYARLGTDAILAELERQE